MHIAVRSDATTGSSRGSLLKKEVAMNTLPTVGRSLFIWLVLALFAVVASLPVAVRAGSDEDYTKRPGYVDFEPMLGGMESSVEILLKGSLLVIAREAVKSEDPELSDMLSRIEYVRVQVFPVDRKSAADLAEKSRGVAKRLEQKGWELAVRVREEGETVHVYVLSGKNSEIQGLVVMAIDENDEAAFVNIVGDIKPAEIGWIGRALHVGAMDVPIKVEVEGAAKVTVDETAEKDITNE